MKHPMASFDSALNEISVKSVSGVYLIEKILKVQHFAIDKYKENRLEKGVVWGWGTSQPRRELK